MFRSLASGAVVSIHCRARRTAEPPRKRQSAGAPASTFLFAVVRDVQRNSSGDAGHNYQEFLFAVVRDVQRNDHRHRNGNAHSIEFLFAVVRDVQRNTRPLQRGRRRQGVSIRCRARRTAEHLHERHACSDSRRFLFAVVRDVQRNSASTYCLTRADKFLFAVVRDVQRNRRTGGGRPHRCVSIRCRARRTAEHIHHGRVWNHPEVVSIRCRARRTAEHGHDVSDQMRQAQDVSIRCRARRTAERRRSFATSPRSTCFYSLSCETYSGTP